MITARASPAEDDLIQARADLAGLPKATYVRQAALAGPGGALTGTTPGGPSAGGADLQTQEELVSALVSAAGALLGEGVWASAPPEARQALAAELDRLALALNRAIGGAPPP